MQTVSPYRSQHFSSRVTLSLFHKLGLPTLALLFLAMSAPVSAGNSRPDPCSIAGNFNGTSIAAGDSVWFNSVFHLPSFNASRLTSPFTIHFTGVTVSFIAKGVNYTINAPNAAITYDPSATIATTTL
jgi:hypothetical protein